MGHISDNAAAAIDELRKKDSNTTFQSSLDKFECTIAEMETQGMIPVIKEHSFHMMGPPTLDLNPCIESKRETRSGVLTITDNLLDLPEAEREKLIATPSFPIPNPLIVPDRLFATFTPVLNIRHPCHIISSLRRATQAVVREFPDDDAAIETQLKWQRMVFDCYKAWFSTSGGIEVAGDLSVAKQLPIILDGDKLANDPQGQMDKLCRILKLDPAGIQYAWEAQPIEDLRQAMYNTTIRNSTGVIKGKEGSDRVPVLEEEVNKWREEWDEKSAQAMQFWVEKTMADYEYLLERSI
ncbi:hypothetical protein L218DRAFT_49741 [Marasmius fiardii PR-910]|nr:hypothetical protein L218DRAFT_49741 [Marasmius fiardii PR-910]